MDTEGCQIATRRPRWPSKLIPLWSGHHTDPWLHIADRLARLDRRIPLYHHLVHRAWAWALVRSLRG